MGGAGEGPVQSQLSNLPHYAGTGVKAQAFVRVLFFLGLPIENYISNNNMLSEYLKRQFCLSGSAGPKRVVDRFGERSLKQGLIVQI
jgi:hypothetical protein